MIQNSLSCGEVGRLCIDLLIQNHPNMRKVGFYKSAYLDHRVQVSNLQGKYSLLLNAEFYQFGPYTFLQFRGGLKEGRKKEFLEEIYDFLKSNDFKSIIFLASLSITERHDFEINSKVPNVYYLSNDHFNERQSQEKVIDLGGFTPLKVLKREDQKDTDVLEGSGLAYHFFKRREFSEFRFCVLFVYAAHLTDINSAAILLRSFVNSQVGSSTFKALNFNENDVCKTINYSLESVLMQEPL